MAVFAGLDPAAGTRVASGTPWICPPASLPHHTGYGKGATIIFSFSLCLSLVLYILFLSRSGSCKISLLYVISQTTLKPFFYDPCQLTFTNLSLYDCSQLSFSNPSSHSPTSPSMILLSFLSPSSLFFLSAIRSFLIQLLSLSSTFQKPTALSLSYTTLLHTGGNGRPGGARPGAGDWWSLHRAAGFCARSGNRATPLG